MNKLFIYNNYDNQEVMRVYLSLIGDAFKENGYKVEFVDSLDGIDRKSLILFPVSKDAFKYYIRGYHNIIQWQQGIASEESYMRHHSYLRSKLLDMIDAFVLKRARMVFYVSNAMKKYYENRYSIDTTKKSIVIPCFNEILDSRLIDDKKYDGTVFAYVGSLSEWQCFDETLSLYKSIEDRIKNTKLLVLTFEKDKAISIIKQKKIKNYCVNSVEQANVKYELLDVTYGFAIRKDNWVNRVATPTKLSSYLAAGVIPIFSDCIEDFTQLSKRIDLGIPVNSDDSVETIIKRITASAINQDDIKSKIKYVFNTYYNYDFYSNALINKINILFRKGKTQ